MSSPAIVQLNAGHHKRVQKGHPWVFSNEIKSNPSLKSLEPGTIVHFKAHDQSSLGYGFYNHRSLISGRIIARSPLPPPESWILDRLERALAYRTHRYGRPYYRLIHAEGDALPGLIIDRYDDILVVQENCAGIDRLTPLLLKNLATLLSPRIIILKNDSASRELEGLPRETKVIGGELTEAISLEQNGLIYFADLTEGQKTGWFYDQTANHALVAQYVQPSMMVLDLYAHTGGFGLLAAHRGAKSVTLIDSSERALDLANQAIKTNHLENAHTQKADVFSLLENYPTNHPGFELVIADPPAFIKSRKDLASGTRGYKKLAKLAAQCVKSGGFLFMASCSHHMDLATFTQQIAEGIFDARRQGRILHTVFAGPDHPLDPHLPESGYLKGIMIQIEDI